MREPGKGGRKKGKEWGNDVKNSRRELNCRKLIHSVRYAIICIVK